MRARYTPLRWATAFASQGGQLLQVMKEYFWADEKRPKAWESLARIYEIHSIDPHVKSGRGSETAGLTNRSRMQRPRNAGRPKRTPLH